MPQSKRNQRNRKKKKTSTAMAPYRAPRGGGGRDPSITTSLVCGLSDPFCGHAKSGKWPDGANTRSLTVPIHSRHALSTDANGRASCIVFPSWLYEPITDAASVSGFLATYSGNRTAATRLAGVNMVRLNSLGVKIRGVSAPLYASGILRIRGFGSGDSVSMGTLDVASYFCDYYEDIPLRDCREVCVVMKKLGPSANLFVNPNNIDPNLGSVTECFFPGFGAFNIAVTGGPASVQVVDIEIFANFEVTFNDGSAQAYLATDAPKFSPQLVDAANAVTSQAKSVFLAGATEAAKTFTRLAGAAIVSRFAGPRAGYAALTVD